MAVNNRRANFWLRASPPRRSTAFPSPIQFSLRGIFIGVAVVGIILAIFFSYRRPTFVQKPRITVTKEQWGSSTSQRRISMAVTFSNGDTEIYWDEEPWGSLDEFLVQWPYSTIERERRYYRVEDFSSDHRTKYQNVPASRQLTSQMKENFARLIKLIDADDLEQLSWFDYFAPTSKQGADADNCRLTIPLKRDFDRSVKIRN